MRVRLYKVLKKCKASTHHETTYNDQSSQLTKPLTVIEAVDPMLAASIRSTIVQLLAVEVVAARDPRLPDQVPTLGLTLRQSITDFDERHAD